MAKEILCGFGVGVDAVAGWLSSYGGEDSPSDISRGMFAGEVGTPRLLNLFDQFNIPTTWFMPGHSIETFPRQMEAVVNAGHDPYDENSVLIDSKFGVPACRLISQYLNQMGSLSSS